MTPNGPIAIVGMACRFPAAPSLADFWTLLCQGADGIGPVPKQRWNAEALFDADAKAPGKMNTRVGGFIEDVDRFDAAFFGISPREATQMDPQQRILLELAYEAFEDAGIAPGTLSGTDAAVYVGAMTNDYMRHQLADGYRRIDVHSGSGSGLCMLANRLSYQFDLRGPSAAVDSACSSSLVAVFHACQSLWTGQSRVALAAGVNVMLDPGFNVFYAKAGLSAPDARCKTFSAAADGIGRSEGAGVVVLKPLRSALQSGDRVYAVIRGGAVNHDGRSNGLTQPNRWAQEQVLRLAFDHAGVDPRELQYVELHGTGTLIGDPIEANALATALSERGERDAPCLVGSVKTNIGHLEAAAGIAGLIKLALSIFHGEIPPSLWFDAPNPHIAFEKMPIRVNTHRLPWPARGERRRAGISSFGLGGTNVHLVLESAPVRPELVESARPEPAEERWLFLSARSETALKALAARYIEFLAVTPEADLPAVCATALRRKGVHDFRLSVIGRDKAALIEQLQAFLSGVEDPRIVRGRFLRSRRRVLLAVPGHGRVAGARLARWLAAAPVARESWDACRTLLRECGAAVLPPLDTLAAHPEVTEGDPDFRAWHFAGQYALLKQLIASVRAVEVIVADGPGQLAALCAAGALTPDAAVRWLHAGLGRDFITREAASRPTYAIDCDCASGRNPDLAALDWGAPPRPWHARLDPSVEREDADLFLFAPDGIGRFDRSLAAGAGLPVVLEQDGPDGFPRLLAQLSLHHQLQWSACIDNHGFVPLPAYPWQRESFWLPRDPIVVDPSPAGIAYAPADPAADASREAPAAQPPEHALLGRRADLPTPSWESRLSTSVLPYLADHRVQGSIVLPGAAYAELGLAVHHRISGQPQGVLENLEFHKALVIEDGSEPLLRVTYDADSREYVVYSQRRAGQAWRTHARGRLSLLPAARPARARVDELRQRCTQFSDAETHYRDMSARGFQYGRAFQGVRRLWLDPDGGEVLAWIAPDERMAGDAYADHRLHPALFDASLQAVLTPLRAKGDTALYIPVGIRQLKLHRPPAGGFWCHGRLRHDAPGMIEGEVVLFDEAGDVLAEARGVRAQALTKKASQEPDLDQWLYELTWEAAAREAAPRRAGRWLLFMDRDGAGERLSERLSADGAGEIVQIRPGEAFAAPGPAGFVVDSTSKADVLRALKEAAPLEGIVYLWGLDTPGGEDGFAGAAQAAAAAVHLIQALAEERGARPQLVVVTRGAQSVGRDEPLESVAQAPLIALVRVALNEHPELRLRVIDVDRDAGTMPHLAEEILAGGREDELALRGAARYVRRVVRARAGDLDRASARPVLSVSNGPARPRRAPGPGEVEVALELATLTAGSAADTGGVLGGLGVVARTGEGSQAPSTDSGQALRPGDAVLVHLQGPPGPHVVVPAAHALPLAKRNAKVLKANAVWLPAFLSAYYALDQLARLQPEERVLIQHAALPLGLAAVQVARWLGASVYAVVAGAEQAELLRSLGVERVFDGGSLDFADAVMERSGGRGIDAALNLSSGEIAAKTFALLAPFGRFIDLSGRADAPRAAAGSLQSNRSVIAVDAHQLLLARPERLAQMLAQVCRRFRAGDFTAIPVRVFPAAEAAAASAACDAHGRIGAVAVSFDRDPDSAPASAGLFHARGSYLITGGFGGFGLEIAAWMVEQGARDLVLAGRRGASAPEAKQALERLRRSGARVLAVAADVSQEAEVERLLARIAREMPPLKGVFHAAAVLEDSPIDRVDRAQIEHVMGPKALGAWHLHRHTQASALDHFVLFSSIASLVGGPGQASYAMSCAGLDALAHYRRARSLPATSIHWGALGRVGMVARYADGEKHLGRSGVGTFAPAQAVQLLGRVIEWDPVELGVALMDWKLWGRTYPSWKASPKYGALVVEEEAASAPHADAGLLRRLSDLDPGRREAAIADALAGLLGEIMQLAPERIDRNLSLLSIGIDSLMAMDLQALVEKRFAVKISMLELMKGNSLAQLAQHVALTLSVPAAAAPAPEDKRPAQVRVPAPQARRELRLDDAEGVMARLGELTDEEVDLLIAQLMPNEELRR